MPKKPVTIRKAFLVLLPVNYYENSYIKKATFSSEGGFIDIIDIKPWLLLIQY
jgi:hypothetical protein